jgi:hypothetical protein
MVSVMPVLHHFAARAPGSLIEEKAYALAWHYRLTDPEFGEWLASELASLLDQQLAGTELAVLRGIGTAASQGRLESTGPRSLRATELQADELAPVVHGGC